MVTGIGKPFSVLMFRHPGLGVFRAILPRRHRKFPGFSSSSTISAGQPNAPLSLDPSLQALLKDVNISLINHKTRPSPHRELEVFPAEEVLNETVEIDGSHDTSMEDHLRRKSPAAHFGSQQIGSVVIPFELRKSINLLIAGQHGSFSEEHSFAC